MEEVEHKEQCFFCGGMFHYGPHKWYGEYVPRFKLLICHNCQNVNHDGLRHDYEAKFEDYLKANAISAPEKNKEGYYPVPKK